MIMFGTLRLAVRRLLGAVLVLPFVVLSLLPAGLMPARAADGTVMMVLCVGDRTVEVAVDLDGGADHEIAQTCDWAVHGAAAVIPDMVALPRPLAIAPTEHLLAVAGIGPAHDPHGIMARGPPVTF
jgi:hypothetical protein